MNAFTHSKELRSKDVKVGLIKHLKCTNCFRDGYPCAYCANFTTKNTIMRVDEYNNETSCDNITLKERRLMELLHNYKFGSTRVVAIAENGEKCKNCFWSFPCWGCFRRLDQDDFKFDWMHFYELGVEGTFEQYQNDELKYRGVCWHAFSEKSDKKNKK